MLQVGGITTLPASDYSEDVRGAARVTQGGVERARFDLRNGPYAVDDQYESVPRRRRRT